MRTLNLSVSLTLAASGLLAAGVTAGYAVAARRFQHVLHTDALTGAANRAGLMVDVRRRAASGSEFTVALIDLDGFKQVNDTLGHAAGDQVLVDVVRRLRAVVDVLGGLVARLGGDELVVLAPSSSEEASSCLGTELLLAIAEPVTTDLWISASIGLVHALRGDDPRRLLTTADHLMYAAKSAGGSRVQEQDLADVLDEVLERPDIRSRDLLGGQHELASGR